MRQGYHSQSTYEGDPQTDSEKEVGWLQEHIISMPEAGRELREEYSGIPLNNAFPHVLHDRDRAFTIFSYACIGQLMFLNHSIPSSHIINLFSTDSLW